MTRYQFDRFIFNLETHELTRDGEPVPIRPKTAELLACFLENRGQLMTKEALLNHVWHDSHGTEAVLFQTISDLRKVLGSSSCEPSYIQNLKKKGYRWSYEETLELQDSPIRETSSVQPQEQVGRPFRLQPMWVIGSVLVVLIVVLILYKSVQPDEPQRMVLLPFVNETKDVSAAWVEMGLMNMVVALLNETMDEDIPVAEKLPPGLSVLGGQPPTPEQLPVLLKALELDVVVTTRVLQENDRYQLVFTQHRRNGTKEQKVEDEDLLNCAGLMSKALAWGPQRHENAQLQTTYSANPEAVRAFGMAMQSLGMGELEAADLFFGRALEMDKTMTWARIYKARCMERMGNVTEGEQLSREALKEASLKGDPQQMNEALANMATIAGRRGQMDREITYRSKVLQNLSERGNTTAALEARDELAFAYQQKGEFLKAREGYETTLLLARQEKYRQGTARAHLRLAGLDYLEEDFDKALEQCELALGLYRLLGNKWFEAEALSKLGLIYERLDRLDDSLSTHQQAYKLAARVQHKDFLIKACNNLGVFYFHRENMPDAIKWYGKALEEAHSSQSTATKIPISFNLAEAYLKNGRVEEGLKYLAVCRDWFAHGDHKRFSLSIPHEDYQRVLTAYEAALGKDVVAAASPSK